MSPPHSPGTYSVGQLRRLYRDPDEYAALKQRADATPALFLGGPWDGKRKALSYEIDDEVVVVETISQPLRVYGADEGEALEPAPYRTWRYERLYFVDLDYEIMRLYISTSYYPPDPDYRDWPNPSILRWVMRGVAEREERESF